MKWRNEKTWTKQKLFIIPKSLKPFPNCLEPRISDQFQRKHAQNNDTRLKSMIRMRFFFASLGWEPTLQFQCIQTDAEIAELEINNKETDRNKSKVSRISSKRTIDASTPCALMYHFAALIHKTPLNGSQRKKNTNTRKQINKLIDGFAFHDAAEKPKKKTKNKTANCYLLLVHPGLFGLYYSFFSA